MQPEEVLQLIKSRRSVRTYSDRPVADGLVRQVLEAGRWAPSGLNNQPWRFVVVREEGLKGRVARHTRYRKVVESAPVIVPVFIHKPTMYNEVKDHQSMGACLQSMLLMAHALGLGAVWLGIAPGGDRAHAIAELLRLPAGVEPLALVAVGHPAEQKTPEDRFDPDKTHHNVW